MIAVLRAPGVAPARLGPGWIEDTRELFCRAPRPNQGDAS